MSSNTKPSLMFRKAHPTEASFLCALINKAFRNEKTGQTWLFAEQEKRADICSIEDTTKLINGLDSVMLVGLLPDQTDPVACCFVMKPSDPPKAYMTKGAAWLGFLATNPELHRGGFGAAMLKHAEAFVKSEYHATRLEFDFVNTRKELRAWYERCGYQATGARRDFPYGENGREILADGLEFIVLGKEL